MQTPEFHPVHHLSVEHVPMGESLDNWTPGDFILAHGSSVADRLVHLGQRVRIRGDDRRYTAYDHAALVVSETGDLIEAVGPGVQRSNVEKYRNRYYVVVHTGAEPEDAKQAIQFAEWALANRAHYGALTIASLGLTLLVGAKLTFFIDGEFICSGLVARALERTGAIFNRDPVHITPADLAKYYEVEKVPSDTAAVRYGK